MTIKGEEMLNEMAETAPRMAVMVAWKTLEAELAAYAIPLDTPDVPASPVRLASVLVHEGKLSAFDAAAIEVMSRMRNTVVHHKDSPAPSVQQAKSYIHMALVLAERVKAAVRAAVESQGTDSASS